MLEEQRVAADIVAIDLTQQPIPQVALQPHLGVGADLRPQAAQLRVRAAEGEAITPEGERDGDRRWHHLGRGRQQRFEPAQQPFGMIGLDLVPPD